MLRIAAADDVGRGDDNNSGLIWSVPLTGKRFRGRGSQKKIAFADSALLKNDLASGTTDAHSRQQFPQEVCQKFDWKVLKASRSELFMINSA